MIPNSNQAKYKPLVRLRTDVWNTLQTKTLKKKKWLPLVSFIKRSQKYRKKSSFGFINYEAKKLSNFPVYFRYNYQKNLNLRIHIRIIYNKIQDFKLKKYALKAKKKSWLDFAQTLEQRVTSFLYNIRFVKTRGEASLHYKHKRILVNGSYKIINIKKGDVLHFSPYYAKLLKRRIYKNYAKHKKIRYGLSQFVDFDINSMRFIFLNDIKYFKNHSFRFPFEKVIRWYTRV